MAVNIAEIQKLRKMTGAGLADCKKALADADGDINKAIEIIENITREAEVGEIYLAEVKRIEKFGAFVELFPGVDALVHISKLAEERVNKVENNVSTSADELSGLKTDINNVKANFNSLITDLSQLLSENE